MSSTDSKSESINTAIQAQQSAEGSDLPSPRQYPQADVVIYDGRCVFCTAQVKNILRLDGKQRISFVSLHDEFVTQQFPDLTHDQLMEQMYIVPHDEAGYTDRRFAGAAAVRYLTRRLPKLWILAPLMHIPFTYRIQQWCYRQIANRRYRIAGKSGTNCDENGTCQLHHKQ